MNAAFRKFLWGVLIMLFVGFVVSGFYNAWYFLPAGVLAAYGAWRYFY